ncbi:hypothetical protein [Chryseobacterium sp. MP_3.2]|uniref:hypothetical protein n=1 Tax=Chryseobacterium sp. MP_3.2 TaxID=3071712 RepID=UPI002E0A740E|nr:hypothetical protein [Chryseobacterium sp. MP_3.2]
MKRKILKTELILQIIFIFACLIWFILIGMHENEFYIFFYIFPLLAATNFLGFFVRIFTVRSNWMAYYFLAVLIYLPTLFLLSLMVASSTSAFYKIYFYGGSLSISLFYTITGFFIIQDESAILK